VLRLLVDLGWDINAKGRTDGPSNQAWETALHHAAGAGELEMARVILDLGGDPAVRDGRFNTRPLDWARYFNQPELVDLLAPLTVDLVPSE
jgi:ankyrin repeat protein